MVRLPNHRTLKGWVSELRSGRVRLRKRNPNSIMCVWSSPMCNFSWILMLELANLITYIKLCDILMLAHWKSYAVTVDNVYFCTWKGFYKKRQQILEQKVFNLSFQGVIQKKCIRFSALLYFGSDSTLTAVKLHGQRKVFKNFLAFAYLRDTV